MMERRSTELWQRLHPPHSLAESGAGAGEAFNGALAVVSTRMRREKLDLDPVPGCFGTVDMEAACPRRGS